MSTTIKIEAKTFIELAEVVRKHNLTTEQVRACLFGMARQRVFIINEHRPEALATMLEKLDTYKTDLPLFLDIN